MKVRCIGDYDLIRPLTIDGFGRCYLAEHRFLKKEVVVKIVDQYSDVHAEFFHSVYDQIDHPFLIKPLLIDVEENKILFVYDAFLDEKSRSFNLFDFVLSHDLLDEELIFSILLQVAEALDYLSLKKLGYVNLKPTNCLISNNVKNGIQVGLIDFVYPKSGLPHLSLELMNKLVIVWNQNSLEAKGEMFTRYELIRAFLPQESSLEKTDLTSFNSYALGVLAFFLLTKKVPTAHCFRPSLLRSFELDWDRIITSLMTFDPDERPRNFKMFLESTKKEGRIDEKEQKMVHEIVEEMQKSTSIKVSDYQAQHELKPVLKAQELLRPSFDPDPAQVFNIDSTIAPYKPKEKEQIEILPIQTEMVIIPEGDYFRGSNEGARDERPSHRVYLDSFAIDIHPVTNEQFVRFLEVMGGEKDSHNNDLIRLRESRIKRSSGKLIIESGYAKHPVVGVSWYGALGYAKWVGKRLPTEAEWEVASRSLRADMIYPTGTNIERMQANFFSADTTPVMSYPASEIGLFDIAGNVYEWCHDWYDYNYYENSLQEPSNPKGPQQGVYRVLRGGCWKSLKDDLRCSHRHRNNPGTVNKTYGFRCAADVE